MARAASKPIQTEKKVAVIEMMVEETMARHDEFCGQPIKFT